MSDTFRELPLFPLNTVLFPSLPLPLHIFEERYKLMIGTCAVTDRQFGVCLIKEGVEVGGPAEPYEIGTVARIGEIERLPDGRMNLMTFGERRFRVTEIIQREPFLIGRVELLPPCDEVPEVELIDDVTARLLRYLGEVRNAQRLPSRDDLRSDVERLAYLAAATLNLSAPRRQAFLEEDSVLARLERVRELLGRELDSAKLFRQQGDGGPMIGPFSRN